MEAAYLQLYKELKKQILTGTYSYGERFPSKRTTAHESGYSIITVQHAYEILCDEGWLEGRERSGYFVAYSEKGSLALPPIPEIPDAFPKEGEVNSALPFETYSKAMRSVLSDYGEKIMEKSPNKGCVELREALAAYLASQRSMPVSPAQIIIGSGAEYLYSIIVRMLGTDQIYALESPSYETIRLVYERAGATCRMLPMSSDGIYSESLTTTDASVLHVTPFHSWPTGITASASKRREYISWAEQRNGYLIEDDFDSELSASSKAEDTLYSLCPDRVIHINTFTRTVSPALRVGYMVLPPSLLSIYQDKVGFFSCSVPVTEQLLLTELLRSGEFIRHLRRVRRKVRAIKG